MTRFISPNKHHDPKVLFKTTVDGIDQTHRIVVYGYQIEFSDPSSERKATVYPNAHDGIHFGVCLKDRLPYGQGGTLMGERWQGGQCVGMKFDMATAYDHAMAFVKSDTLPKKSRIIE